MSDLPARLRAACDLNAPEVREYAGRHEYDGRIPDYSPAGVRAMVGRLGQGERLQDPYDEACLAAFEDRLRVAFGELELHRKNPLFHLYGLDLACYDREYAPAPERAAARDAHVAAWPDAIDAAVEALDAVPAPVAQSLLPAIEGLAAGIPADAGAAGQAARSAHARLVDHVSKAATSGPPDAALGSAELARLMGSAEATDVDLTDLAARADAERDRVMERLADACGRLGDAGGTEPDVRLRHTAPLDVVRRLVRDHPDGDGVIEAARYWTERAIAFTRERDLVPYHDGECRVGPAPESRRWAMAMMTSAAPGEPEGPSWYYITPPDPSWPARDIEDWLEVFSAATLPGITLHEVAPGHFSHGRALRHLTSDVRRTLHSEAFIEGWAHYAEELCVEEGFLSDPAHDPRHASDAVRCEIGIWVEALVRITRLACAIGVHTGAMTVDDATARFEADTHLAGSAARSEARRALFDPTYGRYTWGKLEIMRLREEARSGWAAGFSLSRFHGAMFTLGSPPLGLLRTALS